MEFGTELDQSIDENGMARLESLSFEVYNESDVLIGAIERYKERTGHYPQGILVYKIFLNRENLAFCKRHGIRLSRLALGRPRKNAMADKKQNILTMQSVWRLNGYAVWLSGVIVWGRS